MNTLALSLLAGGLIASAVSGIVIARRHRAKHATPWKATGFTYSHSGYDPQIQDEALRRQRVKLQQLRRKVAPPKAKPAVVVPMRKAR